MGWFGGAPSKISTVSEVPDITQSPNAPQYLEDLTPKFEDNEPKHKQQPTYADAFLKVKLSDFTIDNFVAMPCFREAMLTGFQAMGVLGVVTFLVHKNPARSANWAISGFFLGNVVGWEQCRSLRRKSFQTVEAARHANQEKVQKKMDLMAEEDQLLKKWNDVQSKK